MISHMAFSVVITNSSCGSTKNRHTSVIQITHSITQFGMAVGKIYHTLRGVASQFETSGDFGSLHISSLFLSLIIIIKRKLYR